MSINQTLAFTLTPREYAILTLMLVVFVSALFFTEVRKSAMELVTSFFCKQLFRVYILMAVYSGAWIYVLYIYDLWELHLLKDTVKWFLFAASVMFFNVQNFQKGRKEYTKTFRDIFAGSTLLEFFTDKFSFSYLTELLLISIATLLALMRVLTEKDKKYSQTDKLLRRILMLIGLYFLGHIIFKAIIEWNSWVNIDSLKEFLLAPVLSILLLPFIFLLTVYMTYETQFIALANKLADPELMQYAKRRALIAFKLDQQSLVRWQNRLQFGQIITKEQVINSIKDLKIIQAIEKHPPLIAYEKGWSPYSAKDFLKPAFITRCYDPRFADNWMASSNHVYLGEQYNSNYFRYEVLGKAYVATALELHLTVMTPLEEIDIISPLLAYSCLLFKNAMGTDLPRKLENAIINGKNCKVDVNGTKIRLLKETWRNTLNNCYSVTLAFYRGKPIDY